MLRLELAELDALVELAVVDGDGALGATALVTGLACYQKDTLEPRRFRTSDFFLPLESTTILSLMPNLHSGIPDK